MGVWDQMIIDANKRKLTFNETALKFLVLSFVKLHCAELGIFNAAQTFLPEKMIYLIFNLCTREKFRNNHLCGCVKLFRGIKQPYNEPLITLQKSGGYVLNSIEKYINFMLSFFTPATRPAKNCTHKIVDSWRESNKKPQPNIKNFCLRRKTALRCQKISLF